MKRVLFGLFAVLCSSLALAQTVLPPTIIGTTSVDQKNILQMGIQRVSRADSLVATASGTLANSAVLGLGANVVSSVVTTNDSFTLPTLTGAVQITVFNNGANVLKVWPNASTAQIDTGGAGVGKTVAVNKMTIFTQGTEGLWYSVTSP